MQVFEEYDQPHRKSYPRQVSFRSSKSSPVDMIYLIHAMASKYFTLINAPCCWCIDYCNSNRNHFCGLAHEYQEDNSNSIYLATKSQ